MSNEICNQCAIQDTERCPCLESERLPEYGCYRFEKQHKPFNKKGCPTSCGKCRFLFRKPRSESDDKSYIMCGAVSSLVQKIAPVPNCPHFRPMRKKQAIKRTRLKKSPRNYRKR